MSAGAVTEFFRAIAAVFRALPLLFLTKLENEIDSLDDERFRLSLTGDPDDLLRIETLDQRRERKVERLRALRSAVRQTD